MSIWGPALNQNDDAADWLGELREEPRLRDVQAAVRGALRKGYLDVDRCAEGAAAAQVLSEACGVGGPSSITTKAAMLVIRRELQALTKPAVKTLCKDARVAVAIIRDDEERSELCQLWSEAKQRSAWAAQMSGLEKRLAGAAGSLAKQAEVPSPKATRKQPRHPNLGHVFAIALPNKRFAYAKGFRDYVFAIYDLVSPRLLSLDEVVNEPFAYYEVATHVSPRRGRWKLLGEAPFASSDEAWGPPMASGLVNVAIATHLWITERGVQRTVLYDEAVGLPVWGMGNERTILAGIVHRLVKKRPPEWSDVVLPRSDPRVT